jgi:hypothetical protein
MQLGRFKLMMQGIKQECRAYSQRENKKQWEGRLKMERRCQNAPSPGVYKDGGKISGCHCFLLFRCF